MAGPLLSTFLWWHKVPSRSDLSDLWVAVGLYQSFSPPGHATTTNPLAVIEKRSELSEPQRVKDRVGKRGFRPQPRTGTDSETVAPMVARALQSSQFDTSLFN